MVRDTERMPRQLGVESERTVAQIMEGIQHRWADWCGGNNSLAEGRAGLLLLLQAYGNATGEPVWATLADECIEQAITEMPRGSANAGLFEGLCGTAWAINKVLASRGDSLDSEPFLSSLKSSLEGQEARALDFDLYRGLAGYAVYASEIPSAAGAAVLDLAITTLMEFESAAQGGIFWCRADPYRDGGRVYEDICMAHGLAGVIGSLAYIAAHRTLPPLQMEFLRRLTTSLAKYWHPEAQSYAARVQGSTHEVEYHVGWCNGTPGVTLALFWAAEALEDRALRLRALSLARTFRDHLRVDEVAHAGLCHGAAGLALFGMSLAAQDADQKATWRQFVDACVGSVLSRNSSRYASSGGYGGVRAIPGESVSVIPDRSYLTGAIGVGLVLLQFLHGRRIDLQWAIPLLHRW